MLEPDEAAPLPYLLDIIDPSNNLDYSLRDFIFYNYYYGFPFFALSSIAILPLQLKGEISNLPMVMGILRQRLVYNQWFSRGDPLSQRFFVISYQWFIPLC